jgi:hypothetical protein
MREPDSVEETAQDQAWNEMVEEYISGLTFDPSASEDVKTLVTGNIRGFAVHLKSFLLE